MEAKSKELGPETAPLPRPSAGEDHLRAQAITPNIQLSGGAIHGPDPIPEAREAAGNNLKEGTAMQRIKRISNIKGNIHPARMLIQEAAHRVSDKLEAGPASHTHLGGPRGAIGLSGRAGSAARWRRLKEGGKAGLELTSRSHGNYPAKSGAIWQWA